MYDQVLRWSKHRARRRGAARHGAGRENIPRTREGGEGGMREGGRRNIEASATPGAARFQTGRPGPDRTTRRCQPERCPESLCVSPVAARRQVRFQPARPVPRPVRPALTPAESETTSTESQSGSVCISYFRPLVVLNPYISAQDAPKIGLDHV